MNKLKHSLFVKLMLAFVISGALSASVFVAFSYTMGKKKYRAKHWIQYGQMLAQQLGPQPTQDQIEQIKTKLNLLIRFEKADQVLVSGPLVPTFDKLNKNFDTFYVGTGFRLGRFDNKLAIELDQDSGHYLFILEQDGSSLEERPEALLGLLVSILLILLFTYLFIRRILRPLVTLESGVNEIAQGNLNVSIPVAGDDEFSRLVKSVNTMTAQVRMMIQSKEQLLLDVSHEFRSPLTRIKVALELSDEDARKSIKNSVIELENMVTEILESARLNDAQGKLQLEKINLVDVVKSLVSGYENSTPGIKFYTSKETVYTHADSARLRLAFKNLIENALKYSSHQNQPVEIEVKEVHQKIHIVFKDHGIGIPKDDLGLVFEPFYRVDRSRVKSTGGYGLGLSLCKKIISAHGGHITAQSESQQGTVFTVELNGF